MVLNWLSSTSCFFHMSSASSWASHHRNGNQVERSESSRRRLAAEIRSFPNSAPSWLECSFKQSTTTVRNSTSFRIAQSQAGGWVTIHGYKFCKVEMIWFDNLCKVEMIWLFIKTSVLSEEFRLLLTVIMWNRKF